jgi:hypothetical protein
VSSSDDSPPSSIQLARQISGDASSKARDRRDSRRSNSPQAVSTATPSSPVREPESTTPNNMTANNTPNAALAKAWRRGATVSNSGTTATADHNSSVAR